MTHNGARREAVGQIGEHGGAIAARPPRENMRPPRPIDDEERSLGGVRRDRKVDGRHACREVYAGRTIG
jgi:hypothetical protein